jgi:hypothetical protein
MNADACDPAKAFDDVVFDEFYEQALPVVYGYLLRLCGGDREQEWDLTQDSWVTVVDRLAQGQTDKATVGFLLSVARSRGHDVVASARTGSPGSNRSAVSIGHVGSRRRAARGPVAPGLRLAPCLRLRMVAGRDPNRRPQPRRRHRDLSRGRPRPRSAPRRGRLWPGLAAGVAVLTAHTASKQLNDSAVWGVERVDLPASQWTPGEPLGRPGRVVAGRGYRRMRSRRGRIELS